MNIVIHDLASEKFNSLFPQAAKDMHIVSDNGTIHNCIGCFGCWVKTPGRCVFKDGYDNMGELLAKADKVTIISKCCYGCYSPFVKNVFDRSISYLLPYFRTRNNETHHQKRYNKDLQLSVYFYGENITEQEEETARSLVVANSINFYAQVCQISFLKSPEQISAII